MLDNEGADGIEWALHGGTMLWGDQGIIYPMPQGH